MYSVAIKTGVWRGCGTTANVGIEIYGRNENTGAILLTEPNSKKIFFARGSVNNFILAFPQDLGTLRKIKIWHDNSGAKPAWFFQEILVSDLQTKEEWHFLGNRYKTEPVFRAVFLI